MLLEGRAESSDGAPIWLEDRTLHLERTRQHVAASALTADAQASVGVVEGVSHGAGEGLTARKVDAILGLEGG
ncbi:MAG: hypothetical protein GQE15_07190 [Archangiaceae bacterium]|nr:hypothetical protein [Archangiaceae bacterium]